MTRLMFFLHILGFTYWLGGGFAQMMISIAAKKEDRPSLGTVARLQAAIARGVVGPGAGLVIATGIILTFRSYPTTGEMSAPSVWLMVMQGTGLLGAVLVLTILVPSALRLGRMDPQGQYAATFDALRARQKVVGMISATLGVLALVGGVMLRFPG